MSIIDIIDAALSVSTGVLVYLVIHVAMMWREAKRQRELKDRRNARDRMRRRIRKMTHTHIVGRHIDMNALNYMTNDNEGFGS